MNKVQETMFQSLEGNQSRMVSGDNNSLLATNNRRITIKLKIPRTEILEKEEKSCPLANGSIDNYCVNVRPVVNLMEPLKGWLVSGTRSRKRHARRGQEEEEEEVDEDMLEAASALLLLAQGPPKDFEDVSKKLQVKVSPDGYGFGSDDYGRIFSSGALKIEEKRPNGVINSSEIQTSMMDKGKRKVVLESEFGSDKSMSLSYDWEDTHWTEVESNKRRKVGDLRATMDQICVIPNGHICTICNKSFPTHQALGGHKASHNKPKKIQEDVAGGSRVAAVSGVHVCNICNEIFPTGMALGGHKRRHWTGPVEAPSSSTLETSCPTDVTRTACKVRNLDLNELPPLEEEEEEDGDQNIQPAVADLAQTQWWLLEKNWPILL